MANAIDRPPVKLVIGLIHKKVGDASFETVCNHLQKSFGKIDFQSLTFSYSHTHSNYYQLEMGGPLWKSFVSFEKLICASKLPEIKLLTNQIESEFADCSNLRRVNIDPGYLTAAKFVLASTKNQRHRIYLDKGIYAEIELFFRDKTFSPWEWTYPDYRSLDYINSFNQIRKIYRSQIKSLGLAFY